MISNEFNNYFVSVSSIPKKQRAIYNTMLLIPFTLTESQKKKYAKLLVSSKIMLPIGMTWQQMSLGI